MRISTPRSAISSAFDTPPAAVRTTVAMPSGRIAFMIVLSRLRSSADSILRDTPEYLPVGIRIK